MRGRMKYALLGLVGSVVFGASPVSAQSAWEPMTFSSPATSSGVRLKSTDGQSSLAVRCDRVESEGIANLSIQFLGGPARSISTRPRLYNKGQEPDGFPFAQLWDIVPGSGAYLGPIKNADLPALLVASFAGSEGKQEIVIEAEDANGATVSQAFLIPAESESVLDPVYAACHAGQALIDFPGINPAWQTESQTINNRPVYTAWLKSMDGRERFGVRCEYTADNMQPALVVETIDGPTSDMMPSLFASPGEVLDLPFVRKGREWVYKGRLASLLPQYINSGGNPPLALRRGDKAVTMFLIGSITNNYEMEATINMCNIPL